MIWYNIMGLYSLYKGSFVTYGLHQSAAVHGIVCFINSFCCLLQVVSLDTLHIDSQPVQYLRYVEWSVCSPLMILEMTLASRLTSSQALPILVLTTAFCLCGTIAAFSVTMWMKVFLGVQGSVYCFIVVYRMWKLTLEKEVRLSSSTGLTQEILNFDNVDVQVAIANLLMASLLWPVFVVTWGLGPDVYKVITPTQELIAESIASLILKTFALSYAFITTSKRTEQCIEVMTSLFRFR